jgi:hypothetical protein
MLRYQSYRRRLCQIRRQFADGHQQRDAPCPLGHRKRLLKQHVPVIGRQPHIVFHPRRHKDHRLIASDVINANTWLREGRRRYPEFEVARQLQQRASIRQTLQDGLPRPRDQRDQLAASLTHAAAKQKVLKTTQTAGARGQSAGAQIAAYAKILIASRPYPMLVSYFQFLFDVYGESTQKTPTGVSTRVSAADAHLAATHASSGWAGYSLENDLALVALRQSLGNLALASRLLKVVRLGSLGGARVVGEASGQRAQIESFDDRGRMFRSAVKWAKLIDLSAQLF